MDRLLKSQSLVITIFVIVASLIGVLATILFSVNPVLVILAGLSSGLTVIAIWRPTWGVVIFFLMLPLADLSKRLLFLGGDTVSTLEFQGALLLPDIILLGVFIRALFDLITKRVKYTFLWVDGLFAAFFLWGLFQIIYPTADIYVGMVAFKSSLFYMLLYMSVRLYFEANPWLYKRVLSIILIGATIGAIYSWYQLLFGFPSFEIEWLGSGLSFLASPDELETGGGTIALFNVIRPFSIFASHEQLGFYLVAGIVALLYLIEEHRWLYILMPVLGVTLIRVLSRSSWVAGGVTLGVALLIVLWKRQWGKMASILAMGMCLTLALYFVVINPITQDTGNITQDTGNIQDRAFATGPYEWRIFSYEAFLQSPDWRPLIGNGTGSMWYAWRLQRPDTTVPTATMIREWGGVTQMPSGFRVLSHIGMIDIIYEYGFIGMGIFLSICGGVLFLALRILYFESFKANENLWLITLMVGYVCGVLLANSTVATLLIFRPISAPFWLAIGYIVNKTAGGNRRIHQSPRSLAGSEAFTPIE